MRTNTQKLLAQFHKCQPSETFSVLVGFVVPMVLHGFGILSSWYVVSSILSSEQQ
jgi:hypothetical protein